MAVHAKSETLPNEDTESFQLLAPHFLARIELGSELADQIPAGMRLTASLVKYTTHSPLLSIRG